MRDTNLLVAFALEDMARAHDSLHGRIAYRRAARTARTHDRPLEELASAGRLRDLPHIGPASERIVLEVLGTGTSATVERAVAGSGRRDEIVAARGLRRGFLSRAAALRVLAEPRTGAIRLEDYRGDLQLHTRWSDGAATVTAMARAAAARGEVYIAVTDHSFGLPIAGGMSLAEAARQGREIDARNRRVPQFRVLKGIEANLDAEGDLDVAPADRCRFEIVVAAPHSRLRRAEDQTERMRRAVRQPGVHVLGHPRGRMLSRGGVQARWDEVFAEAAERGVAIELDGDPYRQDLDFELAGRALDAGCLFALDSDAHAPDELHYVEYALAHARLAGLPPERVVNAWPVERLLEWAERRAAARKRPPGPARSRAARSSGG